MHLERGFNSGKHQLHNKCKILSTSVRGWHLPTRSIDRSYLLGRLLTDTQIRVPKGIFKIMRLKNKKVLWLFCYDWDWSACCRMKGRFGFTTAGFNLFSFPSNSRLMGFSILKFTNKLSRKLPPIDAVISHEDQFGCLSAALLAKKLSLPGPSPEAIFRIQHKALFREVLEKVCPEENVKSFPIDMSYGSDPPKNLPFPFFLKPVKASFSVLGSNIQNEAHLAAHLNFGKRELWVIKRLVEPFEEYRRFYFPETLSAHKVIGEQLVGSEFTQHNFDGWVEGGKVHRLGFIDANYYPGTRQFRRWELPSRLLNEKIQERVLGIAQKIVDEVELDRAFFNLEFFFNSKTDQIKIIELNPRLASQFGDMYRRVTGFDPHEMAIRLALGDSATSISRLAPEARVAASFVYRALQPEQVPQRISRKQRQCFEAEFPGALFIYAPKSGYSLKRDFKWTQSHRYGIINLGANSWEELEQKSLSISKIFNWPVC